MRRVVGGLRVPQIFHRSWNTLSRVAVFGVVLAVAAAGWVAAALVDSPYVSGRGLHVEQAVPFSHEHHVGGLGIDCRYCHDSVETSSHAGMPPTARCMHCHREIWTDAAVLAPVRESFATGIPLRWRRVHDLPDFVHFDHSVHVASGFGCESCHGRVDRMPLTRQARAMPMGWCLDCHREPWRHVRPPEKVFEMGWRPPGGRGGEELGRRLARELALRTPTDCNQCHR